MRVNISEEQYKKLPPIIKFNYELKEFEPPRATDRIFEPIYTKYYYSLKVKK